jgi:hypothetical protein
MTAHRWSVLVARELGTLAPLLAVSCAAAPPAEPAAPSHPPVESPPAAPPARPPLGLGPLVNAFSSASTRDRPVRRERAIVRSGAADLVHEAIDWRVGAPSCPLAGDEGCGLYSVRPAGGAWSPPKRAPRSWTTFSTGDKLVFAAREKDTLAIDAIDARGDVTTWLEDATPLQEARVIETPRGDLVFGRAADGFSVTSVETSAAGRRLGTTLKLGIDSAEYRPNAQGARGIETEGHRASWGPPIPVKLTDEQGKPTARWALAWVQVIPPPYGFPAGKTFRRRDKRSAKHDCGGGPLSRSLSDPSVEKRVTLTIFEGTKQVSEVVLDRPERLEVPAAGLGVAAVPGGVSILGAVHDPTGKKLTLSVPAPLAAPELAPRVPLEEEPTALAFDVATSEGLALFRRGDEETVGRRFDAAGAFVGDPLPLPEGVGSHPGRAPMKKVGDTWLVVDEGAVAWLSGPRAGTSVKVPPERVVSLIRYDATHAALITEGESVHWISIDVAAGTIGTPQSAPMKRTYGAFTRLRDEAPILIESNTGRFLDLRTREFEESETKVTHVIDVGGDTAAAWLGPKSVIVTWLSSGESREFPPASFPRYQESWRGTTGPLLPSGIAIPWSPGDGVDTSVKPPSHACPYDVATARGVVVMACTEPTSPTIPMVRTGLRRVVYLEQAAGYSLRPLRHCSDTRGSCPETSSLFVSSDPPAQPFDRDLRQGVSVEIHHARQRIRLPGGPLRPREQLEIAAIAAAHGEDGVDGVETLAVLRLHRSAQIELVAMARDEGDLEMVTIEPVPLADALHLAERLGQADFLGDRRRLPLFLGRLRRPRVGDGRNVAARHPRSMAAHRFGVGAIARRRAGRGRRRRVRRRSLRSIGACALAGEHSEGGEDDDGAAGAKRAIPDHGESHSVLM